MVACGWNEAEEMVRQLAGPLPIYWGTGPTIDTPHVNAWARDAINDARGYNVTAYPEGGGSGKPCTVYQIEVTFPGEVRQVLDY